MLPTRVDKNGLHISKWVVEKMLSVPDIKK